MNRKISGITVHANYFDPLLGGKKPHIKPIQLY